MKVLGIVGSPRRGGNTQQVMEEFLQSCTEEGLQTEIILLADLNIRPCQECLFCKTNRKCKNDRDDFLPVYNKMLNSDAIVVASPVFFGSATAEITALLDRAGYLGIAMGRPFEKKVGGAIAVARRAGHNFTLMQLLHFFLYHGMIIPGSTYWNIVIGKEPGEVLQDTEGMATVKNFAGNLAWLLKKIHQDKR